MEIILSHNNSDFDAVASQLAAWKLFPEAVPVLAVRLNRDVTEFITLFRSGLPFVNWHDAKIRDLERIILTDTAQRPSVKGAKPDTPLYIIEHHPQDRPAEAHETWWQEALGAVTTLLVEEIQRREIPLTLLEATLLALGIYDDTGMLTYSQTTPRDLRAAAWLLEQGAELDTVRKFLITPLNDAQQQLFTVLSQTAETRVLHGYAITVCSTTVDQMVEGINTVTRRIAETVEPTAIVTVVASPRVTQLVARSSDDVVQVGDLASEFGGGGHPRAAAAAIEGLRLDEIVERVWAFMERTIQPAVTVRQLMSRGAQTVTPTDLVRDILPRLRRIGHEGYPVLEDGQITGLLTRRDADRALEHGIVDASVRDVMQAGIHTLAPTDSVAALETMMLESGWGQIPVMEGQRLIGIVTRTDLLRHWVEVHPRPLDSTARALMTLEDAFIPALKALVAQVAAAAQTRQVTAYLVGGVVRDLLLQRPNHDIDIVIEADAIGFAEALRDQYGGSVSSFVPFGTAKWLLDEQVAQAIGADSAELPATVDFATARYEFYTYPTALPTVYSGSINLDLRRRDFTINAMALQLSPANLTGTLVDMFGGRQDLDQKLIRVLHSLSFVDDPTRILRAVRFAERYEFAIEQRTLELIGTAKPMLARITGERLRNELSLLFQEAAPERGIRHLHDLGIDQAMHPSLMMSERVATDMMRLRAQDQSLTQDRTLLHWHLLLADVAASAFDDVTERFLLAQHHSRPMAITATLWQTESLHTPDTRPSDVTALLDTATPITLDALWLMGADSPLRRFVEQYRLTWQHLKPVTNGHTLKALGLPAGARYSRILTALRCAWLDGAVTTAEQEAALLADLLAGARPDES